MNTITKRFAVALLSLGLAGLAFASGAGPMITAHQKPNGSGVVVRYRVEGTPQVGKASTITLEFAGVSDAGGATARFTSDAELALDAGTPASLGLTQGTTSASLQVTPTMEGRYYVNIFTAQRGAKSVTSVAVQVGVKPERAKPQAAGEPEPVIVMPVE